MDFEIRDEVGIVTDGDCATVMVFEKRDEFGIVPNGDCATVMDFENVMKLGLLIFTSLYVDMHFISVINSLSKLKDFNDEEMSVFS
ncbi:hypothetical protein CEXT_384241 [Caerostris extrusa]|uniref:Uncharacterized protein n=1 Tax=Caerostris extrusa TaxID=172846 RepID=A0AAV4QS00_CAEEX|nr:hypothetical protein CEXT_384241 [Caerostris extrusa]